MNIKKLLWMAAGFVLLGIAYIGVIMPGIPFSIPAVFSAYCFARSSERMHKWLYNHKIFGPFLTNWETKKVFPLKAKYGMLGFMALALILMIVTTGNWKAVLYSGSFMAFGAWWGWQYPSSPEEYDQRIKDGKKIGLFK
jgi:uncharacterized membrane protein YbaN (DUF454 family)